MSPQEKNFCRRGHKFESLYRPLKSHSLRVAFLLPDGLLRAGKLISSLLRKIEFPDKRRMIGFGEFGVKSKRHALIVQRLIVNFGAAIQLKHPT